MAPFDCIHTFPAAVAQTFPVSSVIGQAAWSSNVRRRLRELAAMPDGWNGYGSPSIGPEVIEESFTILSELSKLSMPQPVIVPVSGGGVQMEWRKDGVELEIEVMPDKSVHFLMVDKNTDMHEGQITENRNMAEYTPLTVWYLNGNKSIRELASYGSYR